jgi:flavin-dependent dehydrogenase
MKKYKITIERPAWIEETWIIETDDKPTAGSPADTLYYHHLKQLDKWLDDNAEQLGTEVLLLMDDSERKIHGFEIYINDVEEHYEPF